MKTKSQQFTSRFRLTPLAGLHLVHYPTLALPGKPESYQSTQVFAAGRKLVSSALSEQVSASPRQRHPPVLQPRLWSRISESTRADTDYESTCLPVQRSHPARSRARIIARASGVIRLGLHEGQSQTHTSSCWLGASCGKPNRAAAGSLAG